MHLGSLESTQEARVALGFIAQSIITAVVSSCCYTRQFLIKKLKSVKVIKCKDWPIRPAVKSGFWGMKRLGILPLSLGWDARPAL